MLNRALNAMMTIGTGLVGTGVFFNQFTFVVDGGEKAIMFDSVFGSGVRKEVLGEGMHLRFPFVYQPIIYSVRLNHHNIDSKTPARDLQLVNISIRVLERPDIEHLPHLYLTQQKNYADRILPNITQETIKAVVARYNPDQLITQREKVSAEIKSGLVSKAKEFNVIVEDVAILHIEFSKEFRDAIEQKQVSQQMAESEEEKKLTIIRAEAESESARIFNLAINAHGRAFLELKRLEASIEIVTNLSKNTNVTYMPSSGPDAPNFLYKL